MYETDPRKRYWICLKDKSPRVREKVLVCTAHGLYFAKYMGRSELDSKISIFMYIYPGMNRYPESVSGVTHWMKIKPPPGHDDDEEL